MKNIIFSLLAFVGIAITAFGTFLASYVTIAYLQYPESAWSYTGFRDDLSGLAFLVAFGFGLIGLLFTLIGRAVSKQYFFWIVFIVLGLLYCLSFSGLFYQNYKMAQYPHSQTNSGITIGDFVGYFVLLFPGLFFIFAGLLIRIRKNNV